MKSIFPIHLLTVVVLASCYSSAGASPKVAARPNIIVIISDEHNAGVMGCAGDRLARTPKIDALAARGILLGAHYLHLGPRRKPGGTRVVVEKLPV